MESRPLRTDSGRYVTWHVFEDIEYGEFEMVRPFVETSAPEAGQESIPIWVEDYLYPDESVVVTVSHDKQLCPLSSGEHYHRACWQLSVPIDSSGEVRQMLEGPKTGRQVYRFLSPGRLWADRLYSLEVEFSPNPGESKSAYFQEDRWVRRLLNECGLNLPWVQPGVYLESESEWWKVSFTMRDKTLVWAAASTLTGQYYGGNTYTQRLDFTLNLAEQLNRVMEEITGHVPQEKISGYKELVVSIRNSLRDYGYGKKSARCLLSVESIPSEVRIEVSLKAKPSIGAVGSIHLKTSPDTNREELEQGIEWAFEDEGSLVGYNVVNMNKFRENLSMILDEMELADHTEDEGGPTIWMVDVYEENCMMIWRAEDVDDSSRTEGPNILADDLKELLDDPTERFRYRFMMDVVKELGVVENVDEVMNEQIPEVLQQIRRKGRTT